MIMRKHFSYIIYIYRKGVVRRVKKLNPLRNVRAMLKLNPFASVVKRKALLEEKRKLAKDAELAKKRNVSISFYIVVLIDL